MKYPAVERTKFSEITAPTYGVAIDEGRAEANVGHSAGGTSSASLTAPRRVCWYGRWKIRRASRRCRTRSSATARCRRCRSRRHNTFIVMFDPATQLPAAVRTRDADNVYGNSNYDMIPSDWKDAGGGSARTRFVPAQRHGGPAVDLEGGSDQCRDRGENFPGQRCVQGGGRRHRRDRRALSMGVAADVPRPLPRQRQDLLSGGGGFKLVELAPNVQHVQGGTANNLIVAMKDGLVIFDAPVDEGQSRWVIDAAKAKYPGKPIKQLVLTHHHMDHTGGTRTFVAEGAEIVIPGQARPFFEKMFRLSTSYAGRAGEAAEAGEDHGCEGHDVDQGRDGRDPPLQHPESARRWHDHRHVVGPNIVYVTDLISPRGPIGRSPATVAVGDA